MQSYSPLRYPGGKQRLAEWMVRTLRHNRLLGGTYAEPYAGGAGLAMLLLLQGHVNGVVLNDADLGVYAFWKVIRSDARVLIERVLSCPLTVEEHARQRAIYMHPENHKLEDLAFAVLYLNRTSRSGILRGGPIGGKKQTGRWNIGARFPRERLAKLIELIHTYRARIQVYNLDAEEFLQTMVPDLPSKSLVYLDPPYFRNARRLYRNYYREADHERIAKVIKTLPRPWVLTYDDCTEVRALYSGQEMAPLGIYYSANNKTRGNGREIMIWGGGLGVLCPPYATRRVLLKA